MAALRLVAASVMLASLGACSSGDDDPSPALDTGPTTSTSASSPPSADDLVAATGCDNETRRDVDPGEPVEPTSAVNCILGEAQIGIQTYATDGDRDAVMAYLDQFAGFRVIGEGWIIAVDTPEAAATVAERTDGEMVTLAGTSVPAAGADLQAPEPGRAITFEGAGDVLVGQLLNPSLVTQYETPGSCGYWGPNEPTHDGDEPLGGLVAAANTSEPTVRSIEIRNSRYRTASGVGIGTRLATLQRIYGNDLVVDRLDASHQPTGGLVAYYNDVAAIRHGDRALTFVLHQDRVIVVKVSTADFWGDDEGCA